MNEPRKKDELIPLQQTSLALSAEYANFLGEILLTISNSNGDRQSVYSLLEANLDKLQEGIQTRRGVSLPKILRRLAVARLPEMESESAQSMQESIRILGDWIQQFPLGNKAEKLEIAITCYEASAKFFSRDTSPQQWAELQNALGRVYQKRSSHNRTKNIEQAIYYYQEALDVLSREKFPRDWATTYNNLGTAYFDRILGSRLQNIEEAIRCYEQALLVRTFEELPEDWATTQHHLGNAYRDRIYGERADNLEKAISYYQQALKVRSAETLAENWADTQNNLGNAYRERIRGDRAQNLEQAIICYLNSLQIFTREAFPDAWATTQHNLGKVYSETILENREESLEQAILCYKAALEVHTREVSPQEWAATENNLGTAYRHRILGDKANNLEEAIAAYNAALEVFTEDDFPQDWAITQNNLGTVYREKGLIAEATECFWSALEIHSPETNPVECLKAGRNLGDTFFSAGLWADAIEGYLVAIRSVEQSRFWASTDKRRQEVMQQGVDIYANLVQSCINQGKLNLAIEYAERSKTRNLVDLLATRDLYPKGDVPTEILNQLQELRREIVLEQKRIDVVESNQEISEDRTRLNQLRQQLDNLITQKIQPIDDTFSTFYRVKPIKFVDVQKLLPNDHTALIEWYILPETFVAFIVTPQAQEPILWQSSKEDLQALVSWAREYLTADLEELGRWGWKDEEQKLSQTNILQNQRNVQIANAKDLATLLAQLGEILHLEHLLSFILPSCNHLILIPHRFLHLFPLHALPFNNGTCLLDCFPEGVRYAPSSQLLQLTQNQQRTEFSHLFAIQNPTGDLRFSDVEVEILRQNFTYQDVLVRDAAQKTAINNQRLRTAHCVHFACHSTFNIQSPLRTPIVLAGAVSKKAVELERDIFVRQTIQLEKCLILAEVFGLDLSQCRLVNLSACETAWTDYTSFSDEYIGLSSGFIYAGSPSVVCSLWSVNDLATAFLMIQFYNLLRTSTSVAVALNQAQLWLRDVTMTELENWIEENQLPLRPTIKIVISRLFRQIPDDARLFKEPFWWAGFCAIGQ
ncbi:CHAT domain-containing protein [Aetokthonos hydrillicola Thurmond2011]|jgi:CHAT domain-containing protein/TPR repeat protein|uniref:CHAT domain-containing protein n=1 Tax=Aetokthonos hydrillicola Thurmond2011 TaxID=2712845 RepID=A0AAP5I1J7_9CYAN|nr:CHAT domain-containing protein [Aetokthonos hydrillicola]MBO3460149.1 CHAT domain-containing protein [Aetokthonos hydrillicola CCALA 1050]MBW4590476.1 CHAT domain-containing protein [Aetokthonos hydrillicola CCALA 1050]MDR9893005.1 CHAT domain-containing protein [Aetokthonos hydrillicola Thurmond2011]